MTEQRKARRASTIRLPKSEYIIIHSLWENGTSTVEIANKYGICKTTVYNILYAIRGKKIKSDHKCLPSREDIVQDWAPGISSARQYVKDKGICIGAGQLVQKYNLAL